MSKENIAVKVKENKPETLSIPIKGYRLSKNNKTETIKRTEMRYEQRSMHMGPLPSPETLEMYNKIDPSFAERIVSMAEKQSSHRQELERIAVISGSRDSLLGLIFGFVIGVATILAGVWLGLEGHIIPSSVIGTGGVAGLVAVFVYGTRSRRKERESKH